MVESAQDIVHGKVWNVKVLGGELFEGVPETFDAVRYHSLAVRRKGLPNVLKVDAETADGEIMAVSHATRPVFGVQFHPESIGSQFGKVMLANFPQTRGQEGTMSDAVRIAVGKLAGGRASEPGRNRRGVRGDSFAARPNRALIAAFLMGLRTRGETVDDIVAGARVLRANVRPVKAPAGAIDTCGTGGLSWTSLNTSTASAFVAAGAGAVVAKHGNRSQAARPAPATCSRR